MLHFGSRPRRTALRSWIAPTRDRRSQDGVDCRRRRSRRCGRRRDCRSGSQATRPPRISLRGRSGCLRPRSRCLPRPADRPRASRVPSGPFAPDVPKIITKQTPDRIGIDLDPLSHLSPGSTGAARIPRQRLSRSRRALRALRDRGGCPRARRRRPAGASAARTGPASAGKIASPRWCPVPSGCRRARSLSPTRTRGPMCR